VVDLECFETGCLWQPEGAGVIAGAEQHELTAALRQGLANGIVDCTRTHDARGPGAWPAAVDVPGDELAGDRNARRERRDPQPTIQELARQPIIEEPFAGGP
jgi:hypothetical protein